MTISPLQQDYVTKTEFNEFRSDINGRFDKIDSRFKDVDDRFNKIDSRFKDVDDKFEKFKTEIIDTLREDFKNHTGIILETFQHNLKASMEYMDSKLDKKLDRDEFYEYMEIHFPKQIKKTI